MKARAASSTSELAWGYPRAQYTPPTVSVASWQRTSERRVNFFVGPNLLAAALVWWESYVHHLGVPGTNVYDGSVTALEARFNRLNFNIGHHTAHHEKPTLHWSLLPGRTAHILPKIPAACVRETPGPGALVQAERPPFAASGLSARERAGGGIFPNFGEIGPKPSVHEIATWRSASSTGCRWTRTS